MTENEAIDIIHDKIETCEFYFAENDRYPKWCEYEFLESLGAAISALKEIQQYRKIGTVEECREAREKQMPKKIVYESESVFSNGFSHYRMGKCPMCNKYYNSNDEVKYCPKCGQAIKWNENLERIEDGTSEV